MLPTLSVERVLLDSNLKTQEFQDHATPMPAMIHVSLAVALSTMNVTLVGPPSSQISRAEVGSALAVVHKSALILNW